MLFEAAPLMKLEFKNFTLFGFIDLGTLHVTHTYVPESDIIIGYNPVGYPQQERNLDLYVDAHIKLDQSGGLVASNLSGLLYATSNVIREEDFIDSITQAYLQKLAASVSASLREGEHAEEFANLSDEEKHAEVVGLVNQITRTSEKLQALREAALTDAKEELERNHPKAKPATEAIVEEVHEKPSDDEEVDDEANPLAETPTDDEPTDK